MRKSLLLDKIKPSDNIWIIGEDFVEETARRCFAVKSADDIFTPTKFGVRIFACKSFNSPFRTCIARIRNALAFALREVVTPLPKIIFIVIEDDIIKDVKQDFGLPHIYGRCIEWLHHECRKMLAAHNDALPQNARRDVYVTWVLPSRHMNYQNDGKRELFAQCIEEIVEIHNERTFALGFKQNWDPYDPSIFIYDSQLYSGEGIHRLWSSFDRTVWYANVWVDKTEHKKVSDLAQQRLQTSMVNTRGRGQPNSRGGRGRNTYYGRKRYYSKFGKFQKPLPPPPPPRP